MQCDLARTCPIYSHFVCWITLIYIYIILFNRHTHNKFITIRANKCHPTVTHISTSEPLANENSSDSEADVPHVNVTYTNNVDNQSVLVSRQCALRRNLQVDYNYASLELRASLKCLLLIRHIPDVCDGTCNNMNCNDNCLAEVWRNED